MPIYEKIDDKRFKEIDQKEVLLSVGSLKIKLISAKARVIQFQKEVVKIEAQLEEAKKLGCV